MKLWESFDKNEIILLVMVVAAYLVYFLLIRKPDRLAPQIRVLSLLWGLSIGVLYDFTIGGGQTDFYKVNDLNNYEVTDVMYYVLFAPFGYFFFYLYERFKINKKTFIIYVLIWALFGVAIQWVLTKAGIITLQGGYRLAHSFPIFLFTQTITGIYIQLLKAKEQLQAVE
ncbi:hypothetical protein J7I93_24995 [Bacillus sp. ISL-47]|uniref:hypothetical protein n=1 Tax=Bacillus sp. ISL-47 TaxID=2819130 RepID=UPI001BECA1E4|nr:hypothetical protein [Bacillus sp. ISL-47]MBT2691384.1 hypothetical protein [Bacillus sp. ISL-47]MBT2711234.1 hypothetical protein [Pseudomonas sp. ISL-84]